MVQVPASTSVVSALPRPPDHKTLAPPAPGTPGMTPEIADLLAEVAADTVAETVVQMDEAASPKVETSPEPERRTPKEELAYRLKQQSLLARFGEQGLRERDRAALFDAACEACSEGLETKYSKILEYDPGSSRLVLVSGLGWTGRVEGRASLSVELDSPAGYAFQTGKPVVSNHLENEERFKTPKLLADHGIRRAINVLIQPEIEGRPFGVLEVDAPDEGQFDATDAVFLDAFASVLGAAIARQSVEQRLLAAIEHQALLAREVSHRVKNSLSLVSSLLAMQARGAASDEVREALADAGSRIHAIGQVHDQLWRSPDLETVQLMDFVCQLCEGLSEGSETHQVICDVGDGAVPSDVAIPLGLIVNEFVTNAIKYAYGPEGGVVRVHGLVENGEVRVTVIDEGKGFDLSTARSNRSLGLRVVDSLVKQLHGTLTNEAKGVGSALMLVAPLRERSPEVI